MIRQNRIPGSNTRHLPLIVAFFSVLHSCTVAAGIALLLPADKAAAPDTRHTDDPLLSHSSDMSIPLPVRCVWSAAVEAASGGYSFFLSDDSIVDSSDLYRAAAADTFCDVWNLELDKKYYWRVKTTGNTDSSRTHSFTTFAAWPRMIYVEGTTNARDIGGLEVNDQYSIRQGLLYRSAEFNQTQRITEKGLEQLRLLKIVTEIDLKKNSENPQQVIPWLPRYIRPLSTSGDGMALYLDGLTETPEVVAAVFREMTDARNYPMIMHCRYGADRTGEIFAMTEALLGCSDRQITLGYMWSSLSTFGKRDTSSMYWQEFVTYLRSLDPENGTLLQGTRNYLLSIGITEQELEAIRNILLFKRDENLVSSRGIPQRNRSDASADHRLIRHMMIAPGVNGPRETADATAAVFDLSGRLRYTRPTYPVVQAPGCYIVPVDEKIGHSRAK